MTIRPSDLPLLVSLNMLLEERNVTRAASRLHVSQPALSAQLARLRRLYKDPLLVRSETGRGMVPTPKAEGMAVALRHALSQLDMLSGPSDQFDPHRHAATFRISGSFSAVTMFSQPLILAFQEKRNRQLRVSIRTKTEDANMLGQFENGEVDILLVPRREVPPSLKMRELIADRFVLLQRVGHPRGTKPVTIEEYRDLGHLLVSPSGRMDGLMDRRLSELGFTRDVLVSTPDGDSIGSLLTTTDLVCTLPQGTIDTVGLGLEAYALPFALPDTTLAMAWHSRADKQPAHRWLREEIMRIGRRLHPV